MRSSRSRYAYDGHHLRRVVPGPEGPGNKSRSGPMLQCPNMPVAGTWLPAWTIAVASCRATTWAHWTNRGRIETLPGSWLRSRLSRPNRALPSPCTTQLKDTNPERWIKAESPTEEGRGYPSVIVGQEWRRAGRLHPALPRNKVRRSYRALWCTPGAIRCCRSSGSGPEPEPDRYRVGPGQRLREPTAEYRTHPKSSPKRFGFAPPNYSQHPAVPERRESQHGQPYGPRWPYLSPRHWSLPQRPRRRSAILQQPPSPTVLDRSVSG
jgi:hypothetical protein